jgi:hypothetical protein
MQYMRVKTDPDALDAFYTALEQQGRDMDTYYDRDIDCVDGGGSDVVNALLAAGWTPPASEDG